MKKRTWSEKTKSNLYLLLFVVIIAAVLLGFFGLGALSLRSDRVLQDQYQFQLQEARPLQKAGRYYLQGNWQYYDQKWIQSEPVNPGTPFQKVSVPNSLYAHALDHHTYEYGGCGSYRCWIRGLSYAEPITITVPNLACAYRVYVDGQLVTESGTMSKNPDEVVASPSVQPTKCIIDSGVHELVIEVSSDAFQGLYMTPILTDYNREIVYRNVSLGIRYALMGIVLYAALVLAVITLLSKKNKYFSPWLAPLFFILMLRMLCSTESYAVIQPLLHGLSYEKIFIFLFSNIFIIKLIAILYFRDELKLEVNLPPMALLSTLFLLIVLSADLFPTAVYSNYYFLVLQWFSIVADLYLLNKLGQSLARGEKNAGILCGAYMVLSVSVTIDTFYTSGSLPFHCPNIMPIGLAAFALLLTAMHARNAMVFYHEAQQAKALERELEKANMSVMISQIQPHFLYNALNTIKSLIRRDPKTAENAIIDFACYLRGNMDSLSHQEPIPFRTELEHAKYYCEIEHLRFGDKLHIEYNIQEEGFLVPTLSVQPLMENAIKHGVTKRPEGGTVRLTTKQENGAYWIIVEDDGIGFDPTKVLQEDGRSHVGLANIKYRFETLLSAEVSVHSTLNVGTTVTVRIPMNPKEKE